MNANRIKLLMRKLVARSLVLLLTSIGIHSNVSAQVTAAQTPLFLSSSADPNIMFVLDDSGSMHWEITPDDFVLPYFTFRRIPGLYGGADYENYVASVRYNSGNASESLTARRMRSFSVNKSYYNPAVTYTPWAQADGTLYPNAVPTAAFHHPVRTGLGSRNLTVNTTENAIWVHRDAAGNAFCSITCGENSLTHYPAVYFRYNGAGIDVAANFTQVNIINTTLTYTGDGRASRSDCAAGTCTYAQEIQNFANWYTYYRSRMLSAQAGIGRAFSTQPASMRVGFGAINKAAADIDNVNTRTVIRGVRPFNGANRTSFFNDLYSGVWAPSNTPLRRALDDVGQYFSRADNRGPWGAVPGTNDSTSHLTCRQSYSILMTDGYWTNDATSQASTIAAQGNVDGSSGSTITAAGPPIQSYTYSATTPFTDGNSNTLADVAMHYWNRDLRTDLDNRVPTSNVNPAFWQHMVTYGVGLGVAGTINPNTALSAITANPPVNIAWPNPTSTNAAKIDDLLHAGVNSRGGFFSAADPDTFATELSSVLSSIIARVTSSGSSAAASSATLQTDTLLYNAEFRSAGWSGTLKAKNLDDDGVPLPDSNPASVAWDAEALLASRTPASRRIFTRNALGAAVTLDSGSLSATQTAALGVNPVGAPASSATAQDRINWLYGTESAQLRSRVVDGVTRRIGDIIGSSPQFLYQKDYGYTLLPAPQGTSYRAFRNGATYRARPEVLFVGANDGMFHAFNAANGNELFAFMPSELLLPGASGTHAQINDLMRSDYGHRYFMDGSAALSDVYTSGAWRSAAVGTMGAGGRTVFALDVTNPGTFGASNVMWEFKYSNVACVADPTGAAGSQACRDIGFGVTDPKIVRLASGRWAAVFGNGYNSNGHRARLLVVDMQTGRLLYNLLTPDNTIAGGLASSSNPNGLSSVETTDWPTNALNLTNVFAGDLLGNVWRFNFQTATPTIRRIYTAVDEVAGVRQPITAAPKVVLKPGAPSEVVVLFGTGSFFRVGDDNVTNPQVQTFYGIFEAATATGSAPTRSQLLEQVITTNSFEVVRGSKTYPAGTLRYVTQNPLTASDRGWKVDLPASGERVISTPIIPSGAVQESVRFSTLIPDSDACGSGRQGFLMDMSVLSGGRSSSPAFDVNGDGLVNEGDDNGDQTPSGIEGSTGEKPINVRDPGSNVDNIYGGNGDLIVKGSNTAGPIGRQSWRQLR